MNARLLWTFLIPFYAVGTTWAGECDSKNIDLAKLGYLEVLFDDSSGVNQGHAEMSTLLKTYLPKYYSNLPQSSQIRICEKLVAIPETDVQERLSALLLNSGPMLLKLVQQFAEELQDLTLRELLLQVLGHLPAIPFDQIQAAIQKEYGQSIDALFVSFERDPVNTGTVGQVHKAITRDSLGSLHDVAVKVLDPHFLVGVEEDMGVFRHITIGDLSVQKILRRIYDTLRREARLSHEAEMIRAAGAPLGFNRPEIGNLAVQLAPEIRSTDTVLITRWIDGVSLVGHEKLERPVLIQAFRRLELGYQNWLEQVLLGQGIVLGDTHAGNFIFDAKKNQMHWLDFGMGRKLSSREQTDYLNIAAALLLYTPATQELSARLIAKAVVRLSGEKARSEQAMKSLVWETELILWEAPARGDGVSQNLTKIFKTALELGFELPEASFQLARGMLVLESKLKLMRATIVASAPEGRAEQEFLFWDLKQAHLSAIKDVMKSRKMLVKACVSLLL